jgi:hypothetical protein
MAGIIAEYWLASTKVLKTCQRQKKITAILELLLQICHERTLFRQLLLLLLRADDLDQVFHNFLVILIKRYVLVTLRALCRTEIRHNARGLLMMIF